MSFRQFLENNTVLFDGAMGTQLQENGMSLGVIPETLNIDDPELILNIHRSYVAAGAHVISANTFGASAYKLKETGYSVDVVVSSAIKIAKDSGAKFVALDLGPLGKMMTPIGDLTFDEAYESYRQQVLAGLSADLIIVETMSDLNETRAAVLAGKEHTDLPIIASMTFTEDGRSLTGVTPECFVYTMEALGVDALGVNCSLGPKELLPLVKKILAVASVPVIVQANAGLPMVKENKTVFNYAPILYQEYIQEFLKMGVRIVGGCCGTGPDHIRKLVSLIEDNRIQPIIQKKQPRVCSQNQVHDWSKFTVIGERINPTGNKKLKKSLREDDIDTCIKEAVEQVESGASILDVNVGLPDIDELAVMKKLVEKLGGMVDVPLQIDSAKADVIEAGLRYFPGVGIVNSLNGKQTSMDQIFPIVKKYGAMVIGLTLDENGIPHTAEKRFEIAKKIINEGKKYGIPENRIIIDGLVLTVSAQQKEVMETIKAIELIKNHYDVQTTLGISNVSYGMPNRPLLTRTFMTMAMTAGLNSAIMDPHDKNLLDSISATEVLLNIDKGGEQYIACVSESKSDAKPDENSFFQCVIKGYKEDVKELTLHLLKDLEPLRIVNETLIPILDEVGLLYESKEIFLPQLIRAAETIGVAFDAIKANMKHESGHISKGKIIMATVKGDVHDIGKNLVKILLENYGFNIIDLGKDVSTEMVVTAIEKHQVKLIGLSALMTTTVESMAETIEAVHKLYPDVKIFVGGAVLTASYAKDIGADYYCKDAKASVDVAQHIFG